MVCPGKCVVSRGMGTLAGKATDQKVPGLKSSSTNMPLLSAANDHQL